MKTSLLLIAILSSVLLAADSEEQTEARRLATRLIEVAGVVEQLPAVKAELVGVVDQSSEGFTPEEVILLKQYVGEEVEAGFVPMMVERFASYFTVEELKSLLEDRVTPSIQQKMSNWEEYCRKGGEVWGREVRIRSERRIGAGLAVQILERMGIDEQIPALKQGFAKQARMIQEARGLTDEQTELVKAYWAREIDENYMSNAAMWLAEYFTVPELKALRDLPELADKLAGLGKYAEKRAYDWGVDVGGRAVEYALREAQGARPGKQPKRSGD